MQAPVIHHFANLFAAGLVQRQPNGPMLRCTLTVDDPQTYAAPWTVAFPYKRDSEYVQYEYACYEGNYAMFNRFSGAREQERADR